MSSGAWTGRLSWNYKVSVIARASFFIDEGMKRHWWRGVTSVWYELLLMGLARKVNSQYGYKQAKKTNTSGNLTQAGLVSMLAWLKSDFWKVELAHQPVGLEGGRAVLDMGAEVKEHLRRIQFLLLSLGSSKRVKPMMVSLCISPYVSTMYQLI